MQWTNRSRRRYQLSSSIAFGVENNWSRSTLLWWWEKNSRALNVSLWEAGTQLGSEQLRYQSHESLWEVLRLGATPPKKNMPKNIFAEFFGKLREDIPWLTSYSSVQQHRPFPVPARQKVCYKSSSNAWSAWSYIPLVSGNVGPRTYLGFLRYIGPVDGSWPKTELRPGPW